MKFRADIEGLRAVAIIPVVLNHVDARLAPGGFAGVDIFFVISGFLISRIILQQSAEDTFSYADFYRRRVRRLFPALFVMLAVVSVAAFYVLSPSALAEFGKTLVATVLFVSNIEFDRLSDYFGGVAAFKPLLHTWSLAVEEQFYILFPVLLMATRRWFGQRYGLVLLLSFAISLGLDAWLVSISSKSAFFFGPARAYELAVGALLALDRLPSLNRRGMRELVGWASAAAIGFSFVAFDQNTAWPGFSALLPCVGAAGAIYAGSTGTYSLSQLLSFRPVRFVGAISYSLYLWHWPLLALTRTYFLGSPPLSLLIAAALVSVVLAILSWQFVEKPIRGVSIVAWPFLRTALSAAAGVAVLGISLAAARGVPQRFPVDVRRLFAYAADFNRSRSTCHGGDRRWIPFSHNCTFGDPTAPPDIAIWGDSHGAELSAALGELLPRGRSVMEITFAGCPPALGFTPPKWHRCIAHNADALAGLQKNPTIRTVVIAARYAAYDQDANEWAAFRKGLGATVEALRAARKAIVLVYPVPSYPSFPFPVPDMVGLTVAHGGRASDVRFSRAPIASANAAAISALDQLVDRLHVARVIPATMFCDARVCNAMAGNDVIFFDDSHLSVSGARRVASAILAMTSVRSADRGMP